MENRMKMRQPDRSPPQAISTVIDRKNPAVMQMTLLVKTLTPLYGGGVKAGISDPDMPVRVAAIRGHLRFWWRLLQSRHPDHPRGGETLFAAERALWGGMSEGEGDHASKVRLRISVCAKPQIVSLNEFKQAAKKRDEILNYVLFPARQTADEPSLIKQGLEFQLSVVCDARCTPQQQQEVIDSLRWWASFGGIGARTRRGLGAVQVTGEGITAVTAEEVKRHGCDLVSRARKADALEAWYQAVEKIRDFRQKQGVARNQGPGRSFWPEPDSIRQITNKPNLARNPTAPHPPEHPARISFPRAALGLPILFEFKGTSTDPDKTELLPCNQDRMASPLIVKPMAQADGRFAPIALRLPLDHLDTLHLELREAVGSQRVLHTLSPAEWWSPDKAPLVKPMKEHQGSDAIQAFLSYFGK